MCNQSHDGDSLGVILRKKDKLARSDLSIIISDSYVGYIMLKGREKKKI